MEAVSRPEVMRAGTMVETMAMEIRNESWVQFPRINNKTWAHIGHELKFRTIFQVYYI